MTSEQSTTAVAVVGAGAAGLAAAIFAAQGLGPGQVTVLDGAPRVGAKILVSGGGRCNVTHDHITAADYFAAAPVVRRVLRAFDEQAAVAWFERLGVPLKREPTGKLFPVTDDAHTVLNALVRRCEQLGVSIRTGHRVRDVRRDTQAGYTLVHEQGELQARGLIMATGGRSLPRTGSDGAGYDLVRRLGHTVTPTYQALVPLVLDAAFFHTAVSGISLDVRLRTTVQGKTIDQRRGSLLWTHFGVSGPVVMDASRVWVIAHEQGRQPRLAVNLLDEATFEQVERQWIEQAARQPRRSVLAALSDHLPARLAEALLRHVKIDPSLPLGQLPREARRTLVHALTDLTLPVTQPRGWNYAEVTAGGVPLDEIDPRTMASRKTPNLYLVGEILDCDGRIGGFNFQWAWATGYLAGSAVAQACG